MHESLNRDSGVTEGGRAHQDKGREREREGDGEWGEGWASLCHDNPDLCYEQRCQLSRFRREIHTFLSRVPHSEDPHTGPGTERKFDSKTQSWTVYRQPRYSQNGFDRGDGVLLSAKEKAASTSAVRCKYL